MKRLLQTIIPILAISLLFSCSDNSTGTDGSDNGDNAGGDDPVTYTVSVFKSPSDGGTIDPSTEETYEEGETAELQASPDDGYRFTEWTGDMESTDNPLSFTVDQDYELTANFAKKSYELTVNTEGEGHVAEEVIEETSKEYEHGTVVELTANPAEGYAFAEWKGDLSGTENSQQITVDDAKEVTAVFEKKTYALSVNVDGNGSVTRTPDQAKYEYGTNVELEAKPDDGHRFVGWSGAVESTDNPIQLTMNGEKQLTATFSKKKFYLVENGVTVKCPEADIGDSGTVNGMSYTKREADQITVDNAETTCTSGITSMYKMFEDASNFNGDISSWDVSSVTNMRSMFWGASSFNQDLNNWDVSSVTTMKYMFRDAAIFNGDISNWNVGNVTDMTAMFSGASSFAGDLSGWNVSSVTTMHSMFWGAASFNSNISSWDVSLVSDMSYMFSEAGSFNADLSRWDVGNVTTMSSMFMEATSFNSDIGNWDVSSVSAMSYMFNDAASFNHDLSEWCVQLIDEKPYAFSSGSPLQDNYHPVWGTCPSE